MGQLPRRRLLIPLNGILLCAGGGRRMGYPKAAVRIGEQTLLQRAAAILGNVCGKIIVPGDLPVAPPPECYCIPDAAGVRGPIAGLIAGIESASSPYVIALACDLPLVPPPLLEFLAMRCADGYLAAVPFAFDHFHTLCAAYSRDILPSMIDWVRRGEYSMCELLRTLDTAVCVIDERALSQFGDPAVMLLNVNTRADLEKARVLLEK